MDINWTELFIQFVIVIVVFTVILGGYKWLERWLGKHATGTFGAHFREGFIQSKSKDGRKKISRYYFGLMFLVYFPIALWLHPAFLPFGIFFLASSVAASRFVAVWLVGRQAVLKEKALYEAELAEQQARKKNKDSD